MNVVVVGLRRDIPVGSHSNDVTNSTGLLYHSQPYSRDEVGRKECFVACKRDELHMPFMREVTVLPRQAL
jgi:hypothetical protein